MRTLTPISLKDNRKYDEKWLQNEIAKNPSMLGLGDLEFITKEKRQPHGRLDLVLADSDSGKRYECEIQLGKTDESHIIRTIEYWDIERKRYPQLEHTAVLVAEDVESRFLNVIQLFNGHIPLIVLKMTAVDLGDDISIIFTKVIDETRMASPEEDENDEPADRSYWEKKSNRDMLLLTDELEKLINEVDTDVKLNFVKSYIGHTRHNMSANFCRFKPKKGFVNMLCRAIPDNNNLIQSLEEVGLDVDLVQRDDEVRVRITKKPTKEQAEILKRLVQHSMTAYGF